VAAYNRRYNSAVLGAPSKAEDGAVKEYLLDQTNAQNMAIDSQLAKHRIENVQRTEHFREATGAKRSFNQAYGPKLHLEQVMPGGAYIKGSDQKEHLLKRVIPVHANSAEPMGKLTQPRQYLHDTLQDLAEDVHAELTGHPQRLVELSQSLDPKLLAKEAKIKTRAFVQKYSDLFKIAGNPEVVHALVLSHPARTRSQPVIVQPVPPAAQDLRPSAAQDLRPSTEPPPPAPKAVARPKRGADYYRGLSMMYPTR
jgi:hypothetical protein